MKKKSMRSAFLLSAACLLAACAGNPVKDEGVSSQVLDGLHADGVRQPSGFAADLRQRTKGKVLGLAVLAGLLAAKGGGDGQFEMSGNKELNDLYVEVDGRKTVFSPDESLKYRDPSTAEAEALGRKLGEKGIAFSAQSRYSLKSSASIWGLDYDKLTGKDDYRLYYQVATSLYDGKKELRRITCEGVTRDMHGIDQWRADDLAAVKRDAAAIGDLCADQVMVALGLAPAGMGLTTASTGDADRTNR